MNYSYLFGLGALICWVSVSQVDGHFCYKCHGDIYCCIVDRKPCKNAGQCTESEKRVCPFIGNPFTAVGTRKKWKDCPWHRSGDGNVEHCEEGYTYNPEMQKCVKNASLGKVKELSLNLKEKESGYTCPKKGIFGVKRDCSVFYVCLDPNDDGLKFNCPAGTCFDEGQTVCVPRTESQKQETGSDSRSTHQHNHVKTPTGEQGNAKKDQFYETGVFTGYRQETTIPKFPDDEYLKQIQNIQGVPIWNNSTENDSANMTPQASTTVTTTTTEEPTTPTTRQPERHNCIMPGLFPDWNDCHKYWLCRPTYSHPFNTLQAVHKSCGNQYYSTLDYACVPWKPVECVFDGERKNINTPKRPILLRRQENSSPDKSKKPDSPKVDPSKEALHVDTLHYYRRDRKVYKKNK